MTGAVRIAVVTITAVAVLTTLLWVVYFFVGPGPFRPDYSVFWTAAQVEPAKLYDAEHLTQLQSWLVSPEKGLRPWAYPPSALLVFLPLSLMPFWPSFLVWTFGSLALYLWAARKYVDRLWLLAVSPPVFVALVSGQTSILIAAAAMFALKMDGEFRRGVVLGLAAAIKPQALVAAPFLLNRREMAGFVTGGACLVLASLAFGIGPWIEWIKALPRFGEIAAGLGLVSITPTGIADLTGLPRWPFWLVGAVAGISLAWWSRDKDERLLGLIGGSLLISPYAMIYDMVGLMPVAVAALASATGPRKLLASFPLIGTAGMFTVPLMAAATVYRR